MVKASHYQWFIFFALAHTAGFKPAIAEEEKLTDLSQTLFQPIKEASCSSETESPWKEQSYSSWQVLSCVLDSARVGSLIDEKHFSQARNWQRATLMSLLRAEAIQSLLIQMDARERLRPINARHRKKRMDTRKYRRERDAVHMVDRQGHLVNTLFYVPESCALPAYRLDQAGARSDHTAKKPVENNLQKARHNVLSHTLDLDYKKLLEQLREEHRPGSEDYQKSLEENISRYLEEGHCVYVENSKNKSGCDSLAKKAWVAQVGLEKAESIRQKFSHVSAEDYQHFLFELDPALAEKIGPHKERLIELMAQSYQDFRRGKKPQAQHDRDVRENYLKANERALSRAYNQLRRLCRGDPQLLIFNRALVQDVLARHPQLSQSYCHTFKQTVDSMRRSRSLIEVMELIEPFTFVLAVASSVAPLVEWAGKNRIVMRNITKILRTPHLALSAVGVGLGVVALQKELEYRQLSTLQRYHRLAVALQSPVFDGSQNPRFLSSSTLLEVEKLQSQMGQAQRQRISRIMFYAASFGLGKALGHAEDLLEKKEIGKRSYELLVKLLKRVKEGKD